MQSAAAGTDRPLLARLDPMRSTRAVVDSGVTDLVPQASGRAFEVETYIRLHQEAAVGDARSRLMPWPEIRSLAP